MLRRMVACVVIAALLIAAAPSYVFAQTSSDQVGGGDDLDCGHFFEGAQPGAQAVYDADPEDPYGLDGPIGPTTDGEPQVACDNANLGSETPAQCENFKDVSHAQALLDFTGADDPYGLDPDRDTVACNGGSDELAGSGNGGGRQDQEPLDGVPPETSDTTVFVSTGALSTADSLEARLNARFVALEAQFAAFEVRAENGFGRFPNSEDDVTTGGQGATVVVSTSQQPITMAQRTITHDDKPIVSFQKAKDGDGERGTERKGKRDRHKGKQRDRR